MGRRRIYQHYDVPGTVVAMIQTMIRDYPRRQRLIDADACEHNECARLNAIITDVVNSYEPMLSTIILWDVINSRGYYQSMATNISSKNLYYKVKRKLIEDIAIKCDLI